MCLGLHSITTVWKLNAILSENCTSFSSISGHFKKEDTMTISLKTHGTMTRIVMKGCKHGQSCKTTRIKSTFPKIKIFRWLATIYGVISNMQNCLYDHQDLYPLLLMLRSSSQVCNYIFVDVNIKLQGNLNSINKSTVWTYWSRIKVASQNWKELDHCLHTEVSIHIHACHREVCSFICSLVSTGGV